ncbi:CRE-HTP-3 protein [Caenorhabditis remanei]|uniref:CRE-HTP-3 protein n=1 Tax=Caenorhabditis remanei TaxID=31234 RepID=E3LM53_CAERE|nr:CRE-HTP-3 protein [Caenorhabditis remanei]
MLFEKNSLEAAEATLHGSLQLLSNCVYLVNSTILRERKLLPAEMFREFRVYGDVTGYIVEDETRNGVKIATKLRATDKAILAKLIHKLAIVVEEQDTSTPVETFIWSFAYHSSTSAVAEIGYENQKSTFVVDYNDIDGTCQQFCKIFSELQRVLKKLDSLPRGLVPIVKVAFRGDAHSIEGFHQVDEFVNPEEINRECSIGSVAFPFDNKFQLSYASKFTSPLRSNQQVPAAHQNSAILDAMDSTSDPMIEVPRRTMNYEDYDVYMDHVAPEEEHMESDVINASTNCNVNVGSNIEEHAVLQSEFHGSADADTVHQNAHERTRSPSPKILVRKQSQKIISKKSNSTRKTGNESREIHKKQLLKSTNMLVTEENISDSSETAPQKKRSARRLALLVTDEDKNLAKSAKPNGESNDTVPMEVDDVPAEKHNDSEFKKKYERGKSLVENVQAIDEDPVSSGKKDDENTDSRKGFVKRYGYTASFKDKIQSGKRGDDDLDYMDDDEDEDQKKDDEEENQKKVDDKEDQKKDDKEKEQEKNYEEEDQEKGDEEENQEKDYAEEDQEKDDKEVDDQEKDKDLEEHAPVPVFVSVKKYGRVSSVLGVPEKNTESRRVSTRRAGRVSSILDIFDQPNASEQKEGSISSRNQDGADVIMKGVDAIGIVGALGADISLEEVTNSANRYGRVSSVLANDEKQPPNKSNEGHQSKKYGHSTSLRSRI